MYSHPDYCAVDATPNAHFSILSMADPSPLIGSPPDLCRDNGSGGVKRPRNAFMFFRSSLSRSTPVDDQGQRVEQSGLSKKAGALWKSLTDEQKAPYQRMAEDEKRWYAMHHPGYSYSKAWKEGREHTLSKEKSRRNRKIKKLSDSEASTTSILPLPIPAQYPYYPSYNLLVPGIHQNLLIDNSGNNAVDAFPSPLQFPSSEWQTSAPALPPRPGQAGFLLNFSAPIPPAEPGSGLPTSPFLSEEQFNALIVGLTYGRSCPRLLIICRPPFHSRQSH